jgi:hypothetical protein
MAADPALTQHHARRMSGCVVTGTPVIIVAGLEHGQAMMGHALDRSDESGGFVPHPCSNDLDRASCGTNPPPDGFG